jgi:two-component system, chemotaxis family, protein-glutamate methylesterase/glutaminase
MMAAQVKQNKVRVLIVDDSAMIRKVLSLGLSNDPGIEVVGTAADGEQALEMVGTLAPDVITLDIEMPRSDGVTFLRRMMPQWRVPTVVISGVTSEGADVTLQALEAGAVDIIAKPTLGIGGGLPKIMADICLRVRNAAHAKPVLGYATVPGHSKAAAPVVQQRMGRPDRHVIVIGASTGGVQALSHLLPMLPANAPGIVVVQHMPAGFTGSFAKRLDDICAIRVREARDGDHIRPGTALIAPGGNRHLSVHGRWPNVHVVLEEGPPVCFSVPSVDVLFRSAALQLGTHCAAALLTGMGKDGAEGMMKIRRAGGRTIAQDEESSVVWGMPGHAATLGAAEQILPLKYIAAALLDPPVAEHPLYTKNEGRSL